MIWKLTNAPYVWDSNHFHTFSNPMFEHCLQFMVQLVHGNFQVGAQFGREHFPNFYWDFNKTLLSAYCVLSRGSFVPCEEFSVLLRFARTEKLDSLFLHLLEDFFHQCMNFVLIFHLSPHILFIVFSERLLPKNLAFISISRNEIRIKFIAKSPVPPV